MTFFTAKIKHLNAIPEEELLGLPSGLIPIPVGEIVPAVDYAGISPIAAQFPHLQVLTATTSLEKWDCIGDHRSCIGTGLVRHGSALFVSIFFQYGTSQATWLADPADQRIWKMFRQWRQAGMALFGLWDKDGYLQLIKKDGINAIGKNLEQRLVNLPEFSGKVLADEAGDLIAHGELVLSASSYIPEVEQLEFAQVCLLRSPKFVAGFEQLVMEHLTDTIQLGNRNLH